MALKQYLVRFTVDGQAVGGVLEDGSVEWEDLATLQQFAEQHLTPPMIGSRYGSDIDTTVAMDIALVGVPSGVSGPSQASARVIFAVEERTQR